MKRMKRVTYNNVRYEVETFPKVKVKNIETNGYIKKIKDEIALLKDETISMVVNLHNSSPTYEYWNIEEALNVLHSFKFEWVSAEFYNSDGKLIKEVSNKK